MTEIAFIDGGLGQEINKRSSAPAAHPLWSIKVMIEEGPDIIKAVHHDYINAGSKVLTVNAYTATPTRMTANGYGEHFEAAQKTAVRLARDARDEAGADVAIAGCLPPLVASYVASAAHDYEQSLDEFRKIVAMQKDGVDLFLIETISNLSEARAAVTAVTEAGFKAFVSLTIADDLTATLRSGEKLDSVLKALADDGVEAVMLNCSFPEAIDAAMPALAASGLRFGAYANGFTAIDGLTPGSTVDNLEARKDLGPEAYAVHVDRWIGHGASIIGGCCEIGPDHIAFLADHLTGKGHELVKLG